MKMIMIFTLFSFLGTILPGFAMDDKNPVAEDDHVFARAGQTIVIKVVENDYAYDDHPFKIQIAVGGKLGNFEKTDSTITYTAGFAILTHMATDTIIYNIIDLENGLLSNFANV